MAGVRHIREDDQIAKPRMGLSLLSTLRTLLGKRHRKVIGSSVRDYVRQQLTEQFVGREFVAIYSRVLGIALALYCGFQFDDIRLVVWVSGAHVISLLLNRHFAQSVFDAMARGDDFDRPSHILAISMGVAAFLWGCYLWTFPHKRLISPEEFVIILAVIVAVSLMILTSALNARALLYTISGTCLGIVPVIISFTQISGYAPMVGFAVLIAILLAYSRLLERQSRGLALMQLRSKTASKKLTQSNKALVTAMRQLRVQADRDGLTKMRNRGAFERAAKAMLGYEGVLGPYVVMLIDIDHFKVINDSFGHTTGDVVLTHIGALLDDWEKHGKNRLSARWGGEEFVVLAEMDAGQTAEELAEELRRRLRVANYGPDWPKTLHTSVSIGCSIAQIPFSIEEQIRFADIALYRAKNEGRDCWRIAS